MNLHEIGVLQGMVRTVLDYAGENRIDAVEAIVLQIGELSLVIPEYVTELYPIVVRDTALRDTRLVIETIPGMAECDDCDEIFNVIAHEGVCPSCGSMRKTVLSGTDFLIKELLVPE
jgi:hydrogenase nickel incorporation protein HypA/HybF